MQNLWMDTRESVALALTRYGAYSPADSSEVEMAFLRAIFIWWRNATLGTWVTTWFSGNAVGTDKFGNRYYQTTDSRRRWVIYAGTIEATRVPPDWHGWLHHTFKDAPQGAELKHRVWETDHIPNQTGTPNAFRPQGSLARSGERPAATGDYQAWSPD